MTQNKRNARLTAKGKRAKNQIYDAIRWQRIEVQRKQEAEKTWNGFDTNLKNRIMEKFVKLDRSANWQKQRRHFNQWIKQYTNVLTYSTLTEIINYEGER